MRITRSRAAMGLALLTATAALAGCGGSGSKPTARLRGVDVATNTIDPTTLADSGAVAVNGAASFNNGQAYGTPNDSYLYVVSGNSNFFGTTTYNFTGGAYTNTFPILTNADGTPAPTAVSVTSPQYPVDLLTDTFYTVYLVGRPDVANATPDLANLDPRFLHPVVLENDQPDPTAGNATIHVLNAAEDAGGIDVNIGGSVPAEFTNIGYASTISGPISNDANISAGTVTVEIHKTGTATVLATSTLTFDPGAKYTLIATEPTALPSPAVLGVAPTTATYGISLVKN